MNTESISEDNIHTKIFTDIWTVAAFRVSKFVEENGTDPKFCFIGHNQWRELRSQRHLSNEMGYMNGTKPELMGMELLVVNRDDFFRVTK